MDDHGYAHPYPAPDLAERHPFVPLDFVRREPAEMRARADGFLAEMQRRRSVRMLSDQPVPFELIERAVETLEGNTNPDVARVLRP